MHAACNKPGFHIFLRVRNCLQETGREREEERERKRRIERGRERDERERESP